MTSREQLERMREPAQTEIRATQWTLFIATASCMALAASDCVDADYVSALGNFGVFAVLLRFYLMAPKVIAIVKKGGQNWIKNEENYLKEHFPWYDVVGKIGWGCLTASVFLQFSGFLM